MKLAPHVSIREQYNPRPSAAEKRFHLWLMDMPCEACGIEPCGVFHHLLSEAPGKRWDRDHELGLPLCHNCHSALHVKSGNELEWCLERGLGDGAMRATEYRTLGRNKGLLPTNEGIAK